MEELRPDAPPDLTAIAKRVVAWHNSHPLARRITPAQVQGVGWVALPFAQRPGVAPLAEDLASHAKVAAPLSLRDRALAAATASASASTPNTGPAHAFELPVLQVQLPLPQRWWVGMKMSWHAARRRRAQAQARRKALLAAFSEDFIAPVSPRQAARWALGHGLAQPGVGDWPLRTVLPDPAWGRQDARLLNLYLATAAIEAGGRRTRVLVPVGGRQPSSAVLGPRLMSSPRGVVALALLAASALAVLQPQLPALAPAADWPGMAAASALKDTTARWAEMALKAREASTANSQASAAQPAAAASAAHEAMAMAPTEDPAAEWTESAAPPAETPADYYSEPAPQAAEPVWSEPQPSAGQDSPHPPTLPFLADTPSLPLTVETPVFASPQAAPTDAAPAPRLAALPPDDPPPQAAAQAPFRPGQRLVPLLDEATKQQAKDTIAALRAARGDAPTPAPGAAAAPVTASFAPSQVDAIAAFALTSRVLRTRAESEQMQAAVRALLAQHTAEPLLVELWPSGEDWRVVCWPFTRKQDAQLARAVLLTRGLRMETVEF